MNDEFLINTIQELIKENTKLERVINILEVGLNVMLEQCDKLPSMLRDEAHATYKNIIELANKFKNK